VEGGSCGSKLESLRMRKRWGWSGGVLLPTVTCRYHEPRKRGKYEKKYVWLIAKGSSPSFLKYYASYGNPKP
jgi:hypothetical protein